MLARQGIQKHEDKAIVAVMKGLKQLNDGLIDSKPVICLINYNELTSNEKQ